MCKLLIIESSAAIRRILIRAAQEADVPLDLVLEAASGIEALGYLEHHADVDLILSEADVAGLGGAALISRVREQYSASDLPVLFVDAASPIRRAPLPWRELGADGVLCSPFTAQSMHDALGPFVSHP